jgi:hypothetical protein
MNEANFDFFDENKSAAFVYSHPPPKKNFHVGTTPEQLILTMPHKRYC